MEYIPTSPRTTPTTEQLIKAGRSESSIFVTIGNTDCLWLNSNAHISVFLSIWREGSVVTARHIALWIANWIVNQHEIKYIVYCIINNCPSINAKWFNDELFKHEDCAEANSYFHSFIWLIVCLYNVKNKILITISQKPKWHLLNAYYVQPAVQNPKTLHLLSCITK